MIGIARTALRALIRRWARNHLTVAAMVVGAGALVAVLAINQSSAQNLADTVNRLQANTAMATLPGASWGLTEQAVVERARKIGGVTRAGTFVTVESGASTVSVQGRAGGGPVRVATMVATADGLAARGASVLSGGFVSDGLEAGNAVLVGSSLGRELGVSDQPGSNTLLLDGAMVFVSGIARDSANDTAVNTALIVPPTTARRLGILPGERTVAIVTVDGAASQVARAVPTALYPTDPGQVSVGTQLSPEKLRDGLLEGSRALVIAMSAVMVGATLFGIVTTMQIAVWERRRELGIARAMGETRLALGAQFLVESTGLGLAGGLLGCVLGVIVSAGVALTNGWAFILPPAVVGVAPLSGLVGAIAGGIPAWNASRVSPAELLRSV